MARKQIAGSVIRNAVLEVLRRSGEPAKTREVVTAVYFFTGNDRVGYDNVRTVLRALAAEQVVVESVDGWQAVES